MFIVNEDNSIYLTRGDVAFFSVSVETDEGEMLKFQPGDVVRFKVTKKNACNNVVLSKDFGIEAETEEVEIYLEGDETKFGGVISKPQEFWYEVELNPYTDPQTILGYDDEDGPKIFKLFPEGGDAVEKDPVTEEDIPVVDEELSLTSTRPVQNQAISRAIIKMREDVKAELNVAKEEIRGIRDEAEEMLTFLGVEDITDNFATMIDYAHLLSGSHVYKQGNVIHASLYICGMFFAYNTAGNFNLFKINELYRPRNEVFSVGILYLGKGIGPGEELFGDPYTFRIKPNGDVSFLIPTESSQYAYVNFTYICE